MPFTEEKDALFICEDPVVSIKMIGKLLETFTLTEKQKLFDEYTSNKDPFRGLLDAMYFLISFCIKAQNSTKSVSKTMKNDIMEKLTFFTVLKLGDKKQDALNFNDFTQKLSESLSMENRKIFSDFICRENAEQIDEVKLFIFMTYK